MRIRTIKPSFFTHDVLAELEPLERIAFIGLWCAADREGRFEWRPKRLKVQILPYDDIDFSRVLHALTTRGFVEKYTVDGVDYGWIPSFTRNQSINHRESESELPGPSEASICGGCDAITTREARVKHASTTRETPARVEGKGREGKGREYNYAANVDCAAEAASVSQEDSAEVYLTRRKRKITGQRLEDFERFWKVWSQGWIGKRDTGKAATGDAWLDIPGYSPELVERIIAAAQKESDERPALIASGKTPKWSQGWINERRWEVEEPADDVPYREIVEAYHKALDGLPRCKTATDERKARLATLFRFFKGNLQSIESYFRLVDRNPSLRGEPWVNLDWLSDTTNCAKILDGNYGK